MVADKLEEVLGRVEGSGIFSRNEELDDVRSQDLVLLSVPFSLASVLPLINDQPFVPEARLARVARAADLLLAFLGRAESYGILSPEQLEAGLSLDDLSHDERRTIKIARARENKRLRVLIEEMEPKFAAADEAAIDLDAELEEQFRAMSIAQLKADVLSALDEVLMLKREASALQMMVQRGGLGRSGPEFDTPDDRVAGDAGSSSSASSSSQKPGASSSSGSSAPPPTSVTITASDLERMRVFGNPNKPKYSIEEWAEAQIAAGHLPSPEETQAMMAAQMAAMAASQSGQEDPNDPDPDGESDAAVYKAREWDDFKDDNPKGWGNSLANNG